MDGVKEKVIRTKGEELGLIAPALLSFGRVATDRQKPWRSIVLRNSFKTSTERLEKWINT